jgi:hypothetical protein
VLEQLSRLSGENVTTTGGVFSVSAATVTPAIFEIKLCQGRTGYFKYSLF